MNEEVTKDQVTLFLIIALTQLNKEYTDEFETTNYFVREIKKEFNRRVRWERKYLDKHLEDAFKVANDDILKVIAELERHHQDIVDESIEKLLKITKDEQ